MGELKLKAGEMNKVIETDCGLVGSRADMLDYLGEIIKQDLVDWNWNNIEEIAEGGREVSELAGDLFLVSNHNGMGWTVKEISFEDFK